jgi:2'-5' RNA ligase
VSARLFVALDVGEEARAALARWSRDAVGEDPVLRLVAPEYLHVTLAFLGHRALDEIEPVGEVVSAVARPLGPLSIGEALWLAPRRPHVLTATVIGELGELHDDLWSALEDAIGVVRETRAFRPHITVARVRKGGSPRTLEIAPPPQVSLGAVSLVLYRSHLGGKGPARYEALRRA